MFSICHESPLGLGRVGLCNQGNSPSKACHPQLSVKITQRGSRRSRLECRCHLSSQFWLRCSILALTWAFSLDGDMVSDMNFLLVPPPPCTVQSPLGNFLRASATISPLCFLVQRALQVPMEISPWNSLQENTLGYENPHQNFSYFQKCSLACDK